MLTFAGPWRIWWDECSRCLLFIVIIGINTRSARTRTRRRRGEKEREKRGRWKKKENKYQNKNKLLRNLHACIAIGNFFRLTAHWETREGCNSLISAACNWVSSTPPGAFCWLSSSFCQPKWENLATKTSYDEKKSLLLCLSSAKLNWGGRVNRRFWILICAVGKFVNESSEKLIEDTTKVSKIKMIYLMIVKIRTQSRFWFIYFSVNLS